MGRTLALYISAALASLTVAACGSAGPSGTAHVTGHHATASPSPSRSLTVLEQVRAWGKGPAGKDLLSFTAAQAKIVAGARKRSVEPMNAGCTDLSTAAADAAADPPMPVRAAEHWYAAALARAQLVATLCVTALTSRNESQLRQVIAEMNGMGEDLRKAAAALRQAEEQSS